MIGQGSPTIPRPRLAPTAVIAAAGRGGRLALLAMLALAPRALPAETIRIRIEWGGDAERIWEGTVSLDQGGTLSEARPLGIEADEPGSMWVDQGQLMIRQPSARAYDGVDLLVTSPLDARLLINLNATDDPDAAVKLVIALADLIGEPHEQQLDAQGNRLLVRRVPGDKLQVRFQRDRLVFSPADGVFNLIVEPHMLPVADGSKVEIKAELVDPRGRQSLWSAEHELVAGRPADVPLAVQLPDREGVYDLIITATTRVNWRQAIPQMLKPQNWKQTVAQRRIQLLVLSPETRAPSTETDDKLSLVVEIDPANPKWHEKLRLDRLPKLWKIPPLWPLGPLGNGNARPRQHPLGELIELNPSGQSPDVSWEAYTLPIEQPGRPHVLEIEYPSDVRQTLGISILEPNAAGALMPIGLDSGVDSAEDLLFEDGAGQHEAPRGGHHKLIFWPRTTTPMVLITNRRNDSPAVYGKIRVWAGWEHLPRASAVFTKTRPQGQPRQERLLAAYLDRPLFPENFSAPESLDSLDGRSLDDWETFYQGGTRLVEYLHYVGYNGLMVSVLADGSTIYPSKILQPTPRFDTGVFFATGQDPVRKDVLEMLFRLFDREGLQLIPMVDFSAPLPQLEAIRRQGGAAGRALEWIGPDGATWCQTYGTKRALAPYYNVLQPPVQDAMLAVVRELIGRYAHHKSFAGLSVRLSSQGYAQLPGPDWGMDDATVARFQQDHKLPVPGEGPGRFADRAAFLAGKHRRLWLEWRAAQLSRFYHRVHTELTDVRRDSRLYLAAAGALAGIESQTELLPALPQRTTMDEALLRVGINARHLQDKPGLVLLRPERLVPGGRLAARATSLEVNQMPDVDDYFSGLAVPGSLFFHPPQEVRIESFDRKSPFKSTYTWLVSQPVPSGRQNRRRFVHSLATLDSLVMVDGGWTLLMGQEESMGDLAAAYRLLPPVRFQQVLNRQGANSSQPVTIRYGTHGGRTYAYVVNDAPFSTTVRVRVDAPAGSRLTELTGSRPVPPLKRDADGTYWTISLRPYDLVAVEISAANVRLSQPQVSLPGTVDAALRQRIHELADRAASLGGPPRPLLEQNVPANPGFERPPAGDNALDQGALPGWLSMQCEDVTIGPDKTQAHGGGQSVKIASKGPVASLVSRPFEAPATGRLEMRVWLRVADARVQPSLQLAFEGNLNGQSFYRWAKLGAAPGPGQAAMPLTVQWKQYIFAINDLPLEGLTQMNVQFSLMGPGEVWVDDVQLFDRAFSPNEVKELTKLIQLANINLQNGKVGDCMRLLEGYWPQFLQENVPLRPRVARNPNPPRRPASEPKPSPGIMDRLKALLPKRP